MKPISQSVIKKDHLAKASGSAIYVADYDPGQMLQGLILRSPHAHARILSIEYPELPKGYFAVDYRDVPGINEVHIVKDDTPVYANTTVEYIGDPVMMLVGPDERELKRLLPQVKVEYEVLPPVIDVRDGDTVFFDYHFGKGDMDAALAQADQIFEETFETGYQEQAYLEPQGLIADFNQGKITVRGSMQCPYYVHGALAKAMGLPPDKVRVIQDVTGGGFGGKEDYPSILACQVAVAAYKAQGKPVRVIFGRREDMEFTSKRHPSLCTYKAAVKNGRVTALDAKVIFNAGAYTTLSAVVLQRGIIAASGVYDIPALKVHGQAVKTNTVPNGAYRGFGAPQTFFAIEMLMEHIAKASGEEPLAFKLRHLVRQGDETSTGGRYHFPVPLPAMVEEVRQMSDFDQKRRLYAQPQSGTTRRGIGISLWFHGAGFTGSGERDIIKAVCRLHKFPDGRVEILASQSDIGQGIKTTLCKIVANELNLLLDQVSYDNPDTDRVPDSGPTVASRSLMTVGELLRRAAIRLRSQWQEGKDQTVEEHFKEPDFVIPFYIDKFQGDAYPTYAWGVCAVEVQVDTLTGFNEILSTWASFDVGTPIDLNIVTGQMEGGLLQGLGYASMEQMAADSKGRIRNNSFSDYIIPTSMDVPLMKVKLHVEPYPDGPYGAKGAGELPLVGAAPAYMSALEQALSGPIYHIPFSAEDALKLIKQSRRAEA
ncbi:MAG: xanthine dehydrogenase family protein molybdopterin-binding subunit [Oscillospiraceae bacterium]|nr:xanthine dehydrogenase family protein molybdopterin-binding subunit [Oscillospiraceae bacterium]MDD4368257.1 xanthine dehydrogenase family protein molybdopterin-binding subunit [Oscillospiraceae bacterium]